MPIRRRTPLLLAVVLTAGGLSGCSGLAGFEALKGCEESEERVERLSSLPLLDAPPPGATAPRGYERVDAGCWEDSGEAWVHAARTYAFPGTPAEVLQHYRTAAAQDGWHPGPSRPRASRMAIDLCFTRSVDGTPTVLNIYSVTPETFGPEGAPLPPELTSGSGYGVEATADAAGGESGC
ncbi:hypothetical protein ACN9M0_21105 [Streptomyces sp. R-07]|uniref:hypothetical protein n=1 Tax=Streptomyces sp. R-07 TaxID=3404052 RepID=UPI003CF12AAA